MALAAASSRRHSAVGEPLTRATAMASRSAADVTGSEASAAALVAAKPSGDPRDGLPVGLTLPAALPMTGLRASAARIVSATTSRTRRARPSAADASPSPESEPSGEAALRARCRSAAPLAAPDGPEEHQDQREGGKKQHAELGVERPEAVR